MQRALELDIEAEVEARFNAAKRDIEESGLQSARSMQSSEHYAKSGRTRKSVQFASSVRTGMTKPTAAATERTRGSHPNLEDDSIQESIQLAESISQSLRSQSVNEISKSRSA